MSAYALEAQPLAMDLYALLREMDPGRLRQETAAATAARLQRFQAALDEALTALEARLTSSSPDDDLASLRERLADIRGAMGDQFDRSAAASRDQMMALRTALLPRYEALRGVLKAEAVHVPALRPTNYRRSLLHVCSGFVAFTVIALLPTTGWLVGISGSFFVYAWAMEFLRRRSPAFNARIMSFYGPVAHPHEWHRVNSATWYCTALLILALTGSPLVCSIAVLVLGVSDPAAAFIGRRWGRTRLVNGRSLEGTVTFALTGFAVAAPLCAVVYSGVPLGAVLALCAVAGVVGALAELFSRNVDDNLTIPVAAGLAAWLLGLFIL